MEDFEIQENVHTTSVSHIRETTGDYDGISQGGNTGSGDNSKGSGKNGRKGKGKGKSPGTDDDKPKKIKTEDQLARAVT